MEGLNRLLKLPDDIQSQIKRDFGSIAELYKKVFDLNKEEHGLILSKSPRLIEIRNELYDIEEKLESYGILDGSDITSEIASDYGDIIVTKRIADLNKYLIPLGTDFEKMKKWLKDKYGI